MRKALALLLLALGCTSEQAVTLVAPTPPAPPGGGVARMLPVVALRWESQPDLPDPTAVRPEGAPISLTAGDGEGLAITALGATAVIEDPLAFTELHLVFKNPSPRAIEGRFEITLPPGATISRFAMLQSYGWQEGEVVELEAARAAYEDFLHRRSDPALLEKQAGNRFQARVFPIPASGEKEIIFSYSQELTRSRDPYRLYLRGLPRLGKLDLRVLYDRREDAAVPRGRRSFELHQADFTPDHDFALPLPAAGAARGLRQDRLAVARITPLAEAGPDPVRSLLVLFDSSASRALGFKAEVERLGRLVDALQKGGGAAMPLVVACFDQDVELIHDGTAGDFGPKQLEAILARKALGASDLGKALHFAATYGPRSHARPARVLLVGDGVVTAGERDAAEYKLLLAQLGRAGIERLDALVDGGIRDESLMKKLAVGGLARDGVVLDGALGTAELAGRLNQRAVSGIKVHVPGSAWVWPAVLDGVQPGDQAIVYADLPADGPFEVELGGAIKGARQVIATGPVERPMLERAMVSAEIRRLMDERGAADDEAARERLKQRVIALSTSHRVLSDFTGLLILETDDDYARFKIDRQALADILTVGPAGVELFDRRRPAAPLAVAADAPAAPPADLAAGEKESERDVAASKKKDDDGAAPKPASAPPPPAPVAAAAPATPPSPAAAPLPPPPPSPAASVAPGGDSRLPPPPAKATANEPTPAEARPRPSPPRQTSASPDAPLPPAPAVERPAPEERHREQAYSRAPAADRAAGGASPPARSSPPPSAPRAPRAQRWAAPGDPLGGVLDDEPLPTGRRQAAADDDDPSGQGTPPYEGKMRDVMELLARKRPKEALDLAQRWREAEPGDVLALVALGEAYEALGNRRAAGRAYGSIIDLFPSRADLRRFAGARLARLGTGADGAFDLVLDTYAEAVAERPDHPASHRFLAYALARAGHPADAFAAILAGARRTYPDGRFAGIERILHEDVGILAAAWIRAQPERKQEILDRLRRLGVELPTRPSLRFVLTWETDANDVDFHILDAAGGHAFYQRPALRSGGELYADVTTGYGPECFTIEGHPRAYPYRLRAHYYARGPMGYGMGNLEILEHDGRGGLRFDERPFVVMTDQAFVNLGTVPGPLPASRP